MLKPLPGWENRYNTPRAAMVIPHYITELLPLTWCAIMFIPRTAVVWLVFSFAQLCRGIAFLVGYESRAEKANLRILVITDYMPPQTHGIAIRFHRYISEMRKAGHEVHCFTTTMRDKSVTSFDHPCLPCIINPYNTGNRMAYSPGFKLAWFLGAMSWDMVHIAYPSILGLQVLPICRWRSIPTYCSHHVDMEFYLDKYIPVRWLWRSGVFVFSLFVKFPAVYWSSVNSSMTRVFLKSHLPQTQSEWYRKNRRIEAIPTGIADERFQRAEGDTVDEGAELRQQLNLPSTTKLWVMVQRLAPEKETDKALLALKHLKDKGVGGVHLVIAGDGPARAELEQTVKDHELPVTFLGNQPNEKLPRFYRAADVFITCSVSETYGLTVLEALASGTPVAWPHCPVFDELWLNRLPPAWSYTHENTAQMLSAIEAASSKEGKKWLLDNPVKASWTAASHELLEQYKGAIEANKDARVTRRKMTRRLEHLTRGLIVACLGYYVLKMYWYLLKPMALRALDYTWWLVTFYF